MKSITANVPFSEIFENPENKKKLEAQLKDVEIIDINKSMQSYISSHLTESEMRTFQKLEDDFYARGKIHRLAKEFHELDVIPEEFKIKDIKETPIAKSLIKIDSLFLSFQDLALKDIDTSQKASEYFINFTNELKTFDKDTQLYLIEKILPSSNTAIWMHSKFNPEDNPEKYKKRWKELVNSLKARLIEYKETLKEDDIKEYKALSKALEKYVNVDAETLKHIIKYKELPSEEKENKPRWKGRPIDARVFNEVTNITVTQMKLCFLFDKPLHTNNLSKTQYKQLSDYKMFKILESYKHLF